MARHWATIPAASAVQITVTVTNAALAAGDPLKQTVIDRLQDGILMRTRRKTQRGFTLVEMIVVIVITGIIAGVVAIFLRAPVQGYVDSARRAEMTDIADTALRRIGRDLRTAVPNSVRVPCSCRFQLHRISADPGWGKISRHSGGRDSHMQRRIWKSKA